jgi:hypothetical protein
VNNLFRKSLVTRSSQSAFNPRALKRGQKRWLKSVVGREKKGEELKYCCLKYEGNIMSASQGE